MYKGTNQSMENNGRQYEVGRKYETDAAVFWKEGFDACRFPLDACRFDPPRDGNRYFAVEQGGKIVKDPDNSRVFSSQMTVLSELSVSELVEVAINYALNHPQDHEPKSGRAVVVRDQEVAAVNGSGCTAISAGEHGIAAGAGEFGITAASGEQAAAIATGDAGVAVATDYKGMAATTGDYASSVSTGEDGLAVASGMGGAATATNVHGLAVATGLDGSASSTAGNGGIAVSSGMNGAASIAGKEGIAIASGPNGMAKAPVGGAICLAERGEWNGTTYPLRNIKAAIVDGNTIKADTWYILKNGEFVEIF